MNKISTTEQSSNSVPSAPDRLHPKIDQFLDRASNAFERRNLKTYLPHERAPTDAQRVHLENRERQLGDFLRPATEPDVLALIGRMTLGLSAASGDEQDSKGRTALYAEILAGKVSFWALTAAADRFLSGAAGDGRWLSKPAELLREANELARPWVEERARILRVLQATVLPAPEPTRAASNAEQVIAETVEHKRAVVREALAKFHAARLESGFAERDAKPRPPTKAEAQAWLDDQLAKPAPAIKLSEAARRTVTLYEPEKAQDGESEQSGYRRAAAE